MDLDVRAALDREVADLAEPPLGTLIGAALRDGRRLRRRRRGATATTGGLAVAGLAVALLVLPGRPDAGQQGIVPAGQPGGPSASARTSVSAVPGAVAQSVGPSPVAAPTAVRLPNGDELVRQVRAAVAAAKLTGVTSVRVLSPSSVTDPMVEVQRSGPSGPGMFRLSVGFLPRGNAPPTPAPGVAATDPANERTSTRPDGTTVTVGGLADNCIQHRYVLVFRPGGIVVQLNNASCLAWDGTRNRPAVPPLSEAQAIELASSPLIGRVG